MRGAEQGANHVIRLPRIGSADAAERAPFPVDMSIQPKRMAHAPNLTPYMDKSIPEWQVRRISADERAGDWQFLALGLRCRMLGPIRHQRGAYGGSLGVPRASATCQLQ